MPFLRKPIETCGTMFQAGFRLSRRRFRHLNSSTPSH